MFLPGFNLWKRLINILRETTTSLVVSGTGIFRQVGGVPGTDEGRVSHDGNYLILNNADGINGVYLQNNGTTILSTSNNNVVTYGTALLIGGGQQAGFSSSITSGIIDAHGVNNTVNGGVRNTWDCALNTAFTNATTTYANTALARTLLAGVTYKIEGYLIASNSTSANGIKLDFNGGTATATAFGANAVQEGTTYVSQPVTSISTTMAFPTAPATVHYRINGTIKVNAAGTVILRAAENSTGGALITLAVGSWLTFTPLVQV